MSGGRMHGGLPPHITSKNTVGRAMLDVLLALIPITAVSIYVHGVPAVLVILLAMGATLATQLVIDVILGRDKLLGDGSAGVTGLLLALCFQPYASWVSIVLAAVLAILVAKELVGGLGLNRYNPALFGRAGVLILAPLVTALGRATGRATPVIDGVSGATPMMALARDMEMDSAASMFFAHQGGALGEVSALAILVGGAYLFMRGHLKWRISAAMTASVVIVTFLAGSNPVYHVLGGGLLLGSLFMATDWTTSPVTHTGQVLFGAGAGLLTVLIRLALPPAEGVAFAILIMNATVPALDRIKRRHGVGRRFPKAARMKIFSRTG